MNVSVIIPVYNAEKFVEKAVKSALEQKQTKEIILIEDGSKDNSLNKCIELEKKYPKVKLYTHENNQNKGASASRNLGIGKSGFPFIAFLDADDFYLPGFFDKAEKIFNTFSHADGVFGSIGAFYYDEKAKKMHLDRIGRDKTGLNIDFNSDSDDLLYSLMKPKTGHFSIIGMVIKKNAILKIGDFDATLIQGEDTDFIWRLSHFCKLYSINKDRLVAMRGVHKNNRVLNKKEQSKYSYIMQKKWVNNIGKYKIQKKSAWLIIRKYLVLHPIVAKYEKCFLSRFFLKFVILLFICIKNPYIFYTLFLKKSRV